MRAACIQNTLVHSAYLQHPFDYDLQESETRPVRGSKVNLASGP